ncbi:hypothetical protein JCM3774_000582, partial [Rhodotorula dairenensis]
MHNASERETPPLALVFPKSKTSEVSSSLAVGTPLGSTSSTRGPGAIPSGLAVTSDSSRRISLSIRQLVSPLTANLAAEGKQPEGDHLTLLTVYNGWAASKFRCAS